MTIFVKSFGDWFCSTGMKGLEGDELMMASTKSLAHFPEPVEAVQRVDFELGVGYVLSKSDGRPLTVFFAGMPSDNTLRFDDYSQLPTAYYETDLKGQGQGFCVTPKQTKLVKGDKFKYGGQEAVVLETDEDITVLMIADHMRVFSTSHLIGVI